MLYDSSISAFPGDLNAVFYRLISRAHICIKCQGTFGLFFRVRWNLEKILEADLRNFQNTINIFNIPLHMSNQILG